jgi:hypothetical protein
MRYRCFLAAVPRRPGIGVLTGEAAEHVQVLVQRDQVISFSLARSRCRCFPGG